MKLKIKKLDFNLVTNDEKSPNKFRFTVWFNAWTYQKSEQLWAGLAQAIIEQVVGRLNKEDQQIFWIKHNKIESKPISDKLKREVRTRLYSILPKWISVYASGIVASVLLMVSGWGEPGTAGGIIGVITTSIIGAAKSLSQRKTEDENVFSELVNDESITQKIHIPNYSEKIGFEYSVEKEIKKILKNIPGHTPIVIFIDDLDRCPPNKVAQVIEALNHITNSKLRCNFILGMDTELVSAALEKEYEDVIEKVPSYAQNVPIGWKFMDKFIQLPIILPPPTSKDLEFYLANQRIKKIGEDFNNLSQESYDEQSREPQQNAKKSNNEQTAQEYTPQIDEDQKRIDEYNKERETIVNKFVNIADQYVDDGSKIADLTKKYAPDFSTNPRELKRFLNLYRLLNFIMKIRGKRSGVENADDSMIARWIDLRFIGQCWFHG